MARVQLVYGFETASLRSFSLGRQGGCGDREDWMSLDARRPSIRGFKALQESDDGK